MCFSLRQAIAQLFPETWPSVFLSFHKGKVDKDKVKMLESKYLKVEV